MVRVILADDHKILRQGLVSLLKSEHDLEIIAEAPNGLEAARLVSELRPDVLIADLRMGGLNGIKLARLVRDRFPETITIILSMFGAEAYVLEALEAGAKGYVVKESSVSELIVAIREVMAGNYFISPEINSERIRKACTEQAEKQRKSRPGNPWLRNIHGGDEEAYGKA